MAENVTERFNALDIKGFGAMGFAFEARRKLVLELFDALQVLKRTRDSVASIYELQFNRVLDGRVEAEGPSPGKIRRWQAHRDSPFLAESLHRVEDWTYGERFAHFELVFDQARFDVVARDFFMTVLDKGPLDRTGYDGRAGAPSAAPEEPGEG